MERVLDRRSTTCTVEPACDTGLAREAPLRVMPETPSVRCFWERSLLGLR